MGPGKPCSIVAEVKPYPMEARLAHLAGLSRAQS